MLSEENLARVRALNEVAERRGQSLAQLALVWALRDERVTSVLIGASSVRQLDANLDSLDRSDLSAEELAEIDRHAVDADINIWARSSAD
jgi:L-glyceraldehyde 3-phosphate reductase